MSYTLDGVILKSGLCSMQVCVPKEMSDDEVEAFANRQNLAGGTLTWKIRRQGDPALNGDNERVPCEDLEGQVHIMLDC